MTMMAGVFTERMPFSDVYIHGLVRDEQNRKMSKSAGNGIDPLLLIERYGTDALRFALVREVAGAGKIYVLTLIVKIKLQQRLRPLEILLTSFGMQLDLLLSILRVKILKIWRNMIYRSFNYQISGFYQDLLESIVRLLIDMKIML